MSKLKFPHASGNSMSITAPATNPASDLELKLPATIGTASQVLRNSSTPGTLEFANAGKVLQVKFSSQGSSDIQSAYSSATLTDMLSATITPVATSSKFLVAANYRAYRNGNGDIAMRTALLRNVAGGGFTELYNYNYDTTNQISNSSAYTKHVTHFWLDAPTYSSGNALIYKSQAASEGSTALNLGKYTEIVVIELAEGAA